MADSHLHLWNRVHGTDPAHTKSARGNQGSFTAIDAYWQIHNATEQFGPVGDGWGWEVKDVMFTNDCVIVRITLWVHEHSNSYDSIGQNLLMTRGQNPKPDDDSAKKALTDAITKGLSYMGFNTDIFLGKFDDNKYVEAQAEKSGQPSKTATYRGGLDMIARIDTEERAREGWTWLRANQAFLTPEDRADLRQRYDTKLIQLGLKEDPNVQRKNDEPTGASGDSAQAEPAPDSSDSNTPVSD